MGGRCENVWVRVAGFSVKTIYFPPDRPDLFEYPGPGRVSGFGGGGGGVVLKVSCGEGVLPPEGSIYYLFHIHNTKREAKENRITSVLLALIVIFSFSL